MRIVITNSIDFHTLEIDSEMDLLNLKALIDDEFKIPPSLQQLLLNGKILQNGTLKSLGIVNDDVILIQKLESKSEQARLHILSDPNLKNQFIRQYPGIEKALDSPEQFERIYNEMQRQANDQKEREMKMARLANDPFDLEGQKLIEEQIRKQNISKNYETALEYNPEFFGRVVMLYINVEVNGVAVKAFVDSGKLQKIQSSCMHTNGRRPRNYSESGLCRKMQYHAVPR